MNKKVWWQSKIIWLNIVTAIIELLQIFGDVNLLPPGYLIIITSVLNIVVRRFLTSEEIISQKYYNELKK